MVEPLEGRPLFKRSRYFRSETLPLVRVQAEKKVEGDLGLHQRAFA